MNIEDTRLAALIGSRICHDLISPIGAINNGLELLQLSGQMSGPETMLIQESCDSARARVAFFRVAYGAVGNGQMIGPREAGDILARLSASSGRHDYQWKVQTDVPRREVQLAFLGLQCVETGLPTGGTVAVHHEGERWRLSIEAGKPALTGPLWDALVQGVVPADLRPEHVQFALLPRILEGTGRRPTVVTTGNLSALVI